MNTSTIIKYSFIILLFIFGTSLQSHAAFVPRKVIAKKEIFKTKQQKRNFKWRQKVKKKVKKRTKPNGDKLHQVFSTIGIILYFVGFIAMLICGIIFAIPALWITATVFLCLPLFCATILLTVFLIALGGGFSMC